MSVGERFQENEFGCVGTDTWQKLTRVANRVGIVRDVSSDHHGSRVTGVSYRMSPQASIGYRWIPSKEPNCWELDLDTSANPQALKSFASLESLAEAIRNKFNRSGRLKPDDELLSQLNRTYLQTVATVAELHAKGQLAGLLIPQSIFYFVDEQSRERVVLPDVGFTWTDDIPPAPHWVTDHPDWSWLWNPEPADQFLKRPFSAEACKQDLRLLARIGHWILTGEKLLGPLPAPMLAIQAERAAAGPDAAGKGKGVVAGKQSKSDNRVARCWQTLYKALDPPEQQWRALRLEPVRTVAQFRTLLETGPLSEHFQQRVRPPTPFPWRTLINVLLLLALLIGGGAAVYNWRGMIGQVFDPMFHWKTTITPPPPPLCPECTFPS